MTPTEAVISYLGKHGKVETRLRESDEGDSEYCQGSSMILAKQLKITEDTLLRILNELKTQETVVRSQQVHPYDSSEYIVTWKMRNNKMS